MIEPRWSDVGGKILGTVVGCAVACFALFDWIGWENAATAAVMVVASGIGIGVAWCGASCCFETFRSVWGTEDHATLKGRIEAARVLVVMLAFAILVLAINACE